MGRKILLFDLDWTLVSTGGAGVKSLNAAFETLFSIPDSMKKVTPDGKTDRAICREMIRLYLKREAEERDIDRLIRAYLDRLADEVPRSPGYRVLPGVPELLQALAVKNHVLLGLGTGNMEEGARIKLSRADLWKRFRFGGYGSDAEDRAVVLKTGADRGRALAGTPVLPSDVVVIGDNIRDVQAGKAIGATTVAVATGPMNYEELAETKPDHLFHDLSETDNVMRILI